jgi:hypothetical protein
LPEQARGGNMATSNHKAAVYVENSATGRFSKVT